jgi:hypothetical protein
MTTFELGAFVVGHVVLALLMRVAPMLGALHAFVCLGLGIIVALRYPPRLTAYVLAYVAGSEVLWRMVGAAIVWELGKYTVVVIAFIALLRMPVRRNRWAAITYFGLLVPSIVLTFAGVDFDRARQLVSFNLSGPLSLALCVMLFSNIRITRDDLRPLLLTIIGPLTGIAALCLFSLATATDIEFVNASNYIAAGEFSANQVSGVLGLGVVLALLVLLLDRKNPPGVRALLAILGVFFAIQAAITFSRSGLALALVSIVCATFYLVRERRTRVTLIGVASVLFVLGRYVVVPKLDEFTGGKFGQRYSEVESDGRTKIAAFDLEVFADHPVVGVGPGMAGLMREQMGLIGAAHTEYTRLFAEHGITGALAIFLLGVIAFRVMRVARIMRYRALVAALLMWSFAFLGVTGMRLVAPSVVVGLACTIAYSFAPPRRRRLGPTVTA